MAPEFPDTDLFGEPVRPRREGPGRPEIVWNRQTSDRVLLGFARGLTVKETAEVVGLSAPTLRKVYFSECRKRKLARVKLEMLQLSRLNDQAADGNVAAEKELARRLDQLRMRDQAEKIAPPPKRAKPKGVKEQRREAAWSAGEADPGWGDLLPTPPSVQ